MHFANGHTNFFLVDVRLIVVFPIDVFDSVEAGCRALSFKISKVISEHICFKFLASTCNIHNINFFIWKEVVGVTNFNISTKF